MFASKVYLSLLLLSGTLAWSQAQHSEEDPPLYVDIYAGPAFTSGNPANANLGAGGGLCFHAFRWIGVAGEVNAFVGNSGVANTTTLVDFLVGPRLEKPHSRSSRVSPFADFLFGGQSMNNSSTQHTYYYGNGTGIAMAGDGGVDFRLTRRLALRAQGGILYSRFAASPSSVSNTRFRGATYLVYRF